MIVDHPGEFGGVTIFQIFVPGVLVIVFLPEEEHRCNQSPQK
jgi:hypothetical protein